jgi:carbon-monoxide dehydrogenase medium subunit
MLWQQYLRPTSLPEALTLLREYAGKARVVAGGTDVLVQLPRGILPTATLIDITALRELKYIREAGGVIALGALATHNDVIASPLCVKRALPLAQACLEVGAPQIRTRATVAGNLITASPANDTITPLMALDAALVLTSVDGERVVPLSAFYAGFRQTVIRPDELLREIRLPALGARDRGIFLKLGLRRAQAISVIDVALVVTREDDGTVSASRIALGSVAPTIIGAPTAEAYLADKRLDEATIAAAARLASADARPIDDLRGSAGYRSATLTSLVAEGLRRIAAGTERAGWPERPILLETPRELTDAPPFADTIETTINGKPYSLPDATGKSLLNALREDAGLTGSKEGCAEGECGACTVWLDGQAVMSCLVPAGQVHGAQVTTIEGLANLTAGASPAESEELLHPLQRAFIEHAAVQCGFCIPGMLMAGARLLDERPEPTLADAQTALSGNICRCTGYRKILDAVMAASGQPSEGAPA